MKSKDAEYNVRKMRTPPPGTAIDPDYRLVFPCPRMSIGRVAHPGKYPNQNLTGYNSRARNFPSTNLAPKWSEGKKSLTSPSLKDFQ